MQVRKGKAPRILTLGTGWNWAVSNPAP